MGPVQLSIVDVLDPGLVPDIENASLGPVPDFNNGEWD